MWNAALAQAADEIERRRKTRKQTLARKSSLPKEDLARNQEVGEMERQNEEESSKQSEGRKEGAQVEIGFGKRQSVPLVLQLPLKRKAARSRAYDHIK